MSTSNETPPFPSNPVLPRRAFLQNVGGAVVTGAVAASSFSPLQSWGAPTLKSAAESSAAQLFQSLTNPQKEVLVFPFEHELRQHHASYRAKSGPVNF